MGCMLRSDLMSLCEIFIQPECAFEVLSRLGETGNVQFLDMTPDVKAFNRSYIMELCGCVEMERKLIYMQGEMMKDNIDIPPLEVEPQALPLNEMKSLDNLLEKWESEVQDLSDNQVALLKNYLELSEMYYVLTHIGNLLGDTELTSESLFGKASSAGDGSAGHLTVMCGVVQRSRCFPFEMMLWRVSRGNIYYRQAADDAFLQDPQTGQELRKVAFLAVFQGEALSSRMEKVCNGFRVNVYSCPETIDERMDMLHKLDVRIGDLEKVIRKTKYHRCKALVTIAKQYSTWIAQIKKAKAIYHTMNMFTLDITRRCLIGQCWVPDLDLPIVKEVLETCSEEMESNVPSFISKIETSLTPPTYHRTNKFTRGFQALINAYGDSTYGELNPGLYTVITFPFLFSVMFGDVCHGMILLAFGAWMVKSEKKFLGKPSTNEIWNIFFGGRYVILLMGVFTLFTGFLYNEYFSKPITLMTPYWKNTFTREEIEKNQYITLNPVFETNSPYIFGVDPIWKLAKNKIMALNSLKMKLSIIIGIVHMIFGLSLSLFNHLYFKRHYAIYLEFIPQMLFLCGLFLWLVILMYMKWFLYSGKTTDLKTGAGCAPLILILFIDMVLASTSKPVEEDCDAYMFEGQEGLQSILVLVSLVCVPILLFGSPVYLNRYNKKRKEEALKKISNFRKYQRIDSDKKEEQSILDEIEKYSTSFGELMIHQAVHTIEFVLSTISHTASYLRLWALSLAHEQLSEMLWVMIFAKLALRDTSSMGPIKIFFIFAIWAVFTLSILVIMEGLSAFLHTLRLHWVEFMSKFYHGGGYPFKPFNFRSILSGDAKDDKEGICKRRAKTEY
ncbi:V-type proton ATPase 116 kDa subunit a 1-like isoform X1 [Pieris napi]|uniref:V-type proton ATPase 116 kDa subunit a 1-like isoform X1 n=1 Tax=Pieris napi TaxID=78633 RepID=UPI001FB8EBA5|nr:V-type proton ATPase 116 kDa subunit a 1-like isoform X1 [Pieris napi]